MARWLVIGLLLAPQDDDSRKAERLVKQAEALVENKQYEEARAIFIAVAQKWPATEAGKVAAYKGGDNCVLDVKKIIDNGPSEHRIDVHVMADSSRYTNADQRSWFGQAQGFGVQLTSGGMLREYQRYFNFWRVNLASKEQGTSTDSKKFDTALGVKTGDGGGGYSIDGAKMAAVSQRLPSNDALYLVLVRMGGGVDSGGGGIVTWSGGGTLVHEFGHAFGGLGDEYTSEPGGMPVGYQRPIGRGVNYSDTPDLARVPWKHWFEKPEVARAAGVGAFEGANAHEKGQWRPTTGGCTMGSGGGGDFCPVCREVMLLAIYRRVNPIDDLSPPSAVVKVKKAGEKYRVEGTDGVPWVLPLQPTTHRLAVRWKLKRLEDPGTATPSDPTAKPEEPKEEKPKARTGERNHARLPFEGEDLKGAVRPDKQGRPLERPVFPEGKLTPGRYLLTVEVRDEVADENKVDPQTKQKVRVPWVIRDKEDLLVERACWDVMVTDR
jgi:hypothetical protein